MTQEHPITPPPELVEKWLCNDGYPWDPSEQVTITITTNRLRNVATQAARWGADQELEACVDWIKYQQESWVLSDLRAARRPKPPSLKEQALGLLNEGPVSDLLDHEVDTIRRALEALPDD